MNRPKGFEKLNGQKFECMIGLTDYKFKIEVGADGGQHPNRVWIFEDVKQTFSKCAFILFDWSSNMYNVYRVDIGAGSNGEFLYARSLKASYMHSMRSFIDELLEKETENLVTNNKLV